VAVLAIMQPDARITARLTTALMGSHHLVVRPSWVDLNRTLRRERIDGCLVDAEHPDREAAARQIMHLRRRHREMAIVVCVESPHALEYYDLGGIGVDGILASATQAAGETRVVVDRALAMARAACILAALEGRFPAPGPEAVAWSVEHAGPCTTVRKLAGALGHTPAGLRHALSSGGLPAPGRVLLWGRLLVAGARLERDGGTVEDVAFSLGYSTASSLARAMKRHTGLTPREVAEGGGMRRVREALVPTTPAAAASTTEAGTPSTDSATAKPGSATLGTRRPVGRWALCAAMLAQVGCATAGTPSVTAVDRGAIERVVDTAPLDQVHFGILAVDARTGRSLYERNAHRRFVPASNQKLLVTATAISLLGADYRYRTSVWATGPVRGGYVEGDLVLVGSGDPSLSERYWPSGVAALRALADSVRLAGVSHVTGSLLFDLSAWDSATVGPTWEVEDLRYGHGATGGAFAINEGQLDVVVRSGSEVGEPAELEWAPKGIDGFVQADIVTAPPESQTRVRASYLPESRRVVLEGVVEHGVVDTLTFALRDPVGQSMAVFARALERSGVQVRRGWRAKWKPGAFVGGECVSGSVVRCGNATRVAVIESPPMSELIAGILEPSQNWMTEQLIRTLGAERGEEGSWSAGVDVVETFLTKGFGVDTLDISMRDGSGLSAYNLVTPRALVRILQHVRSGRHAGAFRSALASPGEEDSTLERRLPELQGRLFAKTGTISNVNSLSGYLVREDGTEVIFSILTNGSGLSSSLVRAGIDEIVLTLAR
jgi:D-alanyl-D-alanine carboxypeptidase/D-alanyl-D-alanine-endopeptidase (penicillin-binding protein 4)